MEKKYWLFSGIVNGFETNMLLYGSEQGVKQYIEEAIRLVGAYRVIAPVVAEALMQVGMKMYTFIEREESHVMNDSEMNQNSDTDDSQDAPVQES